MFKMVKVQEDFKKLFKETFRLQPKGKKGNHFNREFIKSKAKSFQGRDELKQLFRQVMNPNDEKLKKYIEGKKLSQALGYKNKAQNRLVETLENFVVDETPETTLDFLIQGLGFKSKQSEEIISGFFEAEEVEEEKEEIEEKQEMKEEEPKPRLRGSKKAGAGAGADMPAEKKEVVQMATVVEPKLRGALPSVKVKSVKKIEKKKEEEMPKPPSLKKEVSIEEAEEKRKEAEKKLEETIEGIPVPDPPPPQEEGVKMAVEKPKKPEPTEIDKLEPLPSKSDFIPPERLGTRGKTAKELLNDIEYFFKNFSSQLTREKEFFKNVDKSNIDQLRELHNRIVGKLAPKEQKNKKIGIVVDADQYIREQLKKILQEQTFSSLRPADVVIDVGNRAAEGRDPDTKDFGDFAVKRTIDGGLAAQREAIYRYMPSENDDAVGEKGKTAKQRKKPNRLTMLNPRLNNKRTNAIRMNVDNPFRVPQKTIKLKYLY